jgi:hypothetical protein
MKDCGERDGGVCMFLVLAIATAMWKKKEWKGCGRFLYRKKSLSCRWISGARVGMND